MVNVLVAFTSVVSVLSGLAFKVVAYQSPSFKYFENDSLKTLHSEHCVGNTVLTLNDFELPVPNFTIVLQNSSNPHGCNAPIDFFYATK